jgi:hypothetical protein
MACIVGLYIKEGAMQATVVDLRYHMNDVLKALDRNEDVDILYRGKTKGVLKAKVECSGKKVSEHPFFNMRSAERSVEEEMEALRGGRYRDI